MTPMLVNLSRLPALALESQAMPAAWQRVFWVFSTQSDLVENHKNVHG
jgi:hypothetical protein